MQNCKIWTSTLMTSSSSDVAWKMTSYRAETSAEVCHFQIKKFIKPKKEDKMSAILIHLQIVLQKSSSAKMISSDIALVQKLYHLWILSLPSCRYLCPQL